jgi:hypothetical protein
MASSPLTNDDYDPATDPARKAKSKDPVWAYGYWPNLQNRDHVTCILCKTVVCGGIKRLKQHLAGGYGDTTMCNNTTTAIRKQMKEYLESNKRRRPIFLTDQVDDGDVVEVDAIVATQTVQPSSGTAAKRRNSVLQFMPKAKQAAKNSRPVVEIIRKKPAEGVEERHAEGKYQTTMEGSKRSKEEKHFVDMQWVMWFIEAGIPFNAASSRQFEIALEATAQYGLGYIPPTPYQFGEPLLQDC